MELRTSADGFGVWHGGDCLLSHTAALPCIWIGRGEGEFRMHRGNFDIHGAVLSRVALAHATVRDRRIELRQAPDAPLRLTLHVTADGPCATIAFAAADPGDNRLWLRLPATADEHVWGCGEQMSYLDLRGRRFPLWTSEPGVGRDKTTAITQQADAEGRAGGDYHTTNYPQPTFLTSRRVAVHLETTAYCEFDFTAGDHHLLEVWAIPDRLELFAAPSLLELVEALSLRFGRQPPLPDWVLGGAILGLKDGARSFGRLEAIEAAGARIAGLWCEDWCGVRHTSFGRRLFWDWRWDAGRYPDLPARIAALRRRGIRFLGYVNPYLCNDGALFPEAEAAGHLARDAAGGTYLVDFGEFDCGILDLTRPEACRWFADRVIGQEMIGLGLAGWMADFGEYLPVDAHLASGADATLLHNAWPVLWAGVNADAVARAGLTGEALFFMRAGFTGVQRHCPLLWAGDQCVDFSRHDGLQTAICGALSAGLLGNAYHHSDIGGYTSLFGLTRTPELLMRWAEMAAFTPVMRSHEGNKPGDNLQLDGDPAVLAHFARMTRIYVHLAPYLRSLVAEAAARGLPVQRPLFLHFEADRATHAVQDAYLYGSDLLVAPVHQAGAEEWRTYLPAGADWVHLWSGAPYPGGAAVTVPAPFGQPPVFYRAGTPFQDLFTAAARL
jgi:alpha-glucosidase